MGNKIPQYLLETQREQCELPDIKMAKLSFLDKTIINSAGTLKSIYLQAENAANDNVIQKINPYVKLISLIYIVIVISFISNLTAQIIASAFIFLLYIFTGLKVFHIYRKRKKNKDGSKMTSVGSLFYLSE